VIAQPEPSRLARTRYRAAKKRALAVYSVEMRRLLKEKKWDEVADCAACLRLIDPKSGLIKRAVKACEKKDVEIPVIAAESEDAHESFPYRSPGGRARSLGSSGARTAAAKTIRGCQAFLASTQAEDGRWDCDAHGGSKRYDPGVTGLAVLAFLADGPTALTGPYKGNIEKGIGFLLSGTSDDGYLCSRAPMHFIYSHAIATIALCEFAILSGKVSEHRKTLTGARDALLKHQTRGSGWGYGHDEKPDTSVTAWCTLALARLDLAGLPSPESANKGALAWIDRMLDREFGQVGYNQRGGASARPEGKQDRFPAENTQSMTAAACLIRAIAAPDDFRKSERSFTLIVEMQPMAKYPDMYYWFQASNAYRLQTGGIPSYWYENVIAALKPHLVVGGEVAPAGPWGTGEGGSIYSTALCALTLSTPYRENGPPAGRGMTTAQFLRTGKRKVDMRGWHKWVETNTYIDKDTKLMIKATGTLRPKARAPFMSYRGLVKGGKPLHKGHPFGCLLGRFGPNGKLFRMPKDGKPLVVKEPGHLVFLQNAEVATGAEGAWTIEISIER